MAATSAVPATPSRPVTLPEHRSIKLMSGIKETETTPNIMTAQFSNREREKQLEEVLRRENLFLEQWMTMDREACHEYHVRLYDEQTRRDRLFENQHKHECWMWQVHNKHERTLQHQRHLWERQSGEYCPEINQSEKFAVTINRPYLRMSPIFNVDEIRERKRSSDRIATVLPAYAEERSESLRVAD